MQKRKSNKIHPVYLAHSKANNLPSNQAVGGSNPSWRTSSFLSQNQQFQAFEEVPLSFGANFLCGGFQEKLDILRVNNK